MPSSRDDLTSVSLPKSGGIYRGALLNLEVRGPKPADLRIDAGCQVDTRLDMVLTVAFDFVHDM
jgi:hypothetical protein